MLQSSSYYILSAMISSRLGGSSRDRFLYIPQVFTKGARSASTLLDQIILHWFHVRPEAVPPDNLVCMRTSDDSRVDQRIQALDSKLRACETHHRCAATNILSLRSACESESCEEQVLHGVMTTVQVYFRG
jgi:hypothetical protein